MDDIDREINNMYNENKKIPPGKFMAILLTIVGINAAIVIISINEQSIFIRLVLEVASGIIMVSFFTWFFLKIHRES